MAPRIDIEDYASFAYYCGSTLSETFSSYHGRIVGFFAPLPSSGVLRDVTSRVAAAVFSPIFYPLLGVGAVVGRTLVGTTDPVKIQGKILKARIREMRCSGDPEWRTDAIKAIRKARQEKVGHELRRLRGSGVLTNAEERQVDAALRRVRVEPGLAGNNQDAVKVLMAQAMEIRNLYRDTHHVFIHAQASKWLMLTHLIKEFVRIFHPDVNIKHFKFLRAPCQTVSPDLLDTFWGVIKGILKLESGEQESLDVREYLKRQWWINDDNKKTREQLLSVDGYFYNFAAYESSLYFMINNSNIMGDTKTIESILRKVIQHFYSEISENKLTEMTTRLIACTPIDTPCGNLFAICIPKGESEKVQYRSHPLGTPCGCYSEEQAMVILDSLQHGLFDDAIGCTEPLMPKVPQFRIYTPALKPGGDTKIYLLTPFAKEKRKEIKAHARAIVKEVHHLATSVPP